MREPKARPATELDRPRVPVHPELEPQASYDRDPERDEELVGTSSSHHPSPDHRPEEPADPGARADPEP